MANHGLTNEQARQIGAKTLWIGDIETWMDEQYIQNLFNKVSSCSLTTHQCTGGNRRAPFLLNQKMVPGRLNIFFE